MTSFLSRIYKAKYFSNASFFMPLWGITLLMHGAAFKKQCVDSKKVVFIELGMKIGWEYRKTHGYLIYTLPLILPPLSAVTQIMQQWTSFLINKLNSWIFLTSKTHLTLWWLPLFWKSLLMLNLIQISGFGEMKKMENFLLEVPTDLFIQTNGWTVGKAPLPTS